jgi:hypothetical protein
MTVEYVYLGKKEDKKKQRRENKIVNFWFPLMNLVLTMMKAPKTINIIITLSHKSL